MKPLLARLVFAGSLFFPAMVLAQAISNTTIVPLSKLEAWLKLADQMGPEPWRGVIVKPVGSFILPCGGTSTSMPQPPIATTPPGKTCYNKDLVDPPDPRLGTITDEERLELLKFYLLHFRLKLDVTGLNVGMFAGGGAAVGTTAPTTPANIINAFVGRVRYRMYFEIGEIGAMQMKINQLLPGTKLGDATAVSNLSLVVNYQRQLRLLDFMFPDGALWQMLLLDEKKL